MRKIYNWGKDTILGIVAIGEILWELFRLWCWPLFFERKLDLTKPPYSGYRVSLDYKRRYILYDDQPWIYIPHGSVVTNNPKKKTSLLYLKRERKE